LAKNLRTDKCLAKPDNVSDVTTAVKVDHTEGSTYGVQLEVSQRGVPRWDRSRSTPSYLLTIKLIKSLQIDVIGRCIG